MTIGPERRLMRVKRSKFSRAILACGLAIATGTVCFSTIEWLENPAGSAQLVSIQQVPDFSEMCLPESATSDLTAGLQENNLFAAVKETTVYAAGQDAGQTTEVIRRPPLRY